MKNIRKLQIYQMKEDPNIKDTFKKEYYIG